MGQRIVRDWIRRLQPADRVLPVRLEGRQWRSSLVRPEQREHAVAGPARSHARLSASDSEAIGARRTRDPQLHAPRQHRPRPAPGQRHHADRRRADGPALPGPGDRPPLLRCDRPTLHRFRRRAERPPGIGQALSIACQQGPQGSRRRYESSRCGMKLTDSAGQAEPTEPPERSVLSLIRGVQNGSITPSSVAVKERRLCVAHLTAEGYSVAEIAEILKTSDRTIFRDRGAIRQANSVDASPELTSQMVGTLVTEAESSISRIRRATRAGDVPPAAKIEGEKACWIITRDLIDRLQKLGYLPTAAQ